MGTEELPNDDKPILELENEKEQKWIPPNDDYKYPLIKDIIATDNFHNKLEDIVNTIRTPEIFELLGIKPPKIYLFDGPPGTGKTLSAKAIRNELINQGFNVAWHPYDTGTYGSAFINMGAVNMQKYFDVARTLLQRDFLVINFFDEAETILGNRSMNSTSAGKEDTKLLNCVMKNLQDVNSYATNQYVIFATNHASVMDAAAVRAGRIDKTLTFEMPGELELRKAYSHYCNVVNQKANFSLISGINLLELASLSQGFNYADVAAVVNGSVETLAYELLKNGVDENAVPRIGHSYLLDKVKSYRAERKDLVKSVNKNRIGFL